jgi:DNA-binding Lrp family transcriptional regulator
MEAYVLLKISRQREMYGFGRSVVEKLRTIKGVKSADLLFGDYDAIVRVDADRVHNVENLVMEKVSTTEGVESTVTLLCVDETILV